MSSKTSCALCNQFQGRWPISSASLRNEQRHPGNRSLFVPNIIWDDLLKSKEVCYNCKILVDGCRGVFDQRNIKESDIVRCSLRFCYPSYIEDVDIADCDKHLVFHLQTGQRFEIELFATQDDDCPIPDTWDYFPTMKRTSLRTDSPEALTTINDWIVECKEEHSDINCASHEVPRLPKRVIDTGLDNSCVRLVEPNGAIANYVCLSHCWGLEQIITTKMGTFAERKKSIAWKDLSKTFQDAIDLTRRLGLQYIWIDSLCIIQDSVEDWQIESAKMASIYSKAYLTIAGTKSANGLGGLFSSTPDFRVSGTTPNGEDYCLFFRERIDHHIDVSLDSADVNPTETYYPLLCRAWVYQERMLSRRVLHFGRYEMFFECQSEIECECESIRFHGAGQETPVPLIKVEYADTLSSYSHGYKGKALESVQYQGARLWRTMVCCYTALRLTMSKDRLPAFGGLAKQMASGRKSRYLAGLWEDSLNDDLIWTVRMTSKLKRPRPEPRNAPTWSWASVEAVPGVDYGDVILFTDLESDGFEERAPYKHFSTTEHCEVTKSAIDEFGQIANGSLTISGRMVQGVLGRKTEVHDSEEIIQHYVSIGDASLHMDSDYLLDEEGLNQTSPGTPVFCFRMSMLCHGSKDYLISLILKKSPSSPQCFERIGTLKIAGPVGSLDANGGIFQKADSHTVVII
jgi:hypothetical protein